MRAWIRELIYAPSDAARKELQKKRWPDRRGQDIELRRRLGAPMPGQKVRVKPRRRRLTGEALDRWAAAATTVKEKRQRARVVRHHNGIGPLSFDDCVCGRRPCVCSRPVFYECAACKFWHPAEESQCRYVLTMASGETRSKQARRLTVEDLDSIHGVGGWIAEGGAEGPPVSLGLGGDGQAG